MNAPARTPWLRIALLFGAGVAAAMHVGKVPGALGLLRGDLSLSLATAGWVVAIFNLVAAFAGFGFGIAADRYGRARLAFLGLLLLAAASAIGAGAPGVITLLASRAAEGVGFVLVAVCVPALIAATASADDRRAALGIWGANVPLGIGSMLLLTAPLLERIGWRGVWLVAAALALLAAFALRLATRGVSVSAAQAGAASAQMRALAQQRGPWLLGLIFALYAGQYLAVVGFLPSVLAEADGLSPTTAAVLSAVVVLGNVLGNIGSGFALRAGLAPQRLLIGASLAMAAGAALVFTQTAGAVLHVGGGLLFSVVGGLIPGTLFALAPEQAPRPDLLSGVNGLLMQGSAAGQFVLPPIVAAIAASAGSWTPCMLATATAAALVVALPWLLPRPATATQR